MKIVVCIKQVPDNDKIRINPKTNTLVRGSGGSKLNRNDENALEEALKFKDISPEQVEVITLTMGPLSSEEILRQGMAMGADSGILVSDKAFAGADTFVTAKILSKAVRKIGNVNMIITGQFTSDGETGQVPAEMAEMLGIVQSYFTEKISVSDNKIIVERKNEFGIETVEMNFPALIAISERSNEPRNMNLDDIKKACDRGITVWNAADLGLDAGEVGIKGSPTIVESTYVPTSKRKCVRVDGESEPEMIENLFKELAESKFAGGNHGK